MFITSSLLVAQLSCCALAPDVCCTSGWEPPVGAVCCVGDLGKHIEDIENQQWVAYKEEDGHLRDGFM